MEKKYRLTEETIEYRGVILHRIEALMDFQDVSKGDKGGFVESEYNLSHLDTCWIYDDAKAYENSRVSEYAKLSGNAVVYGNAVVCGNAVVKESVEVAEDAIVEGSVELWGEVFVCGNAWLYGKVRAYEKVTLFGYARVYGSVILHGKVQVFGNAELCGNAEITSTSDYIVFKNFWSSGRFFTWTRSNDMYRAGGLHCNGEELIEKAYKESEEDGKNYAAIVKYVNEVVKPQF